MMKLIQGIHPAIFLLVATILEVAGDAIIRTSIYNHTGIARIGFMSMGGILLFGYGCALNLAPVEFREVVGLYIATLFIVWQIGNYIAFQTVPTLPVIVGGILVIAGGLIITFWKPQ